MISLRNLNDLVRMVLVPQLLVLITLCGLVQAGRLRDTVTVEDLITDALLEIEERLATALENQHAEEMKAAIKDFLAIRNSKYKIGKKGIKLMRTVPLKECYISPEKWNYMIDVLAGNDDPIEKMDEIANLRCAKLKGEKPEGLKDKSIIEATIWITRSVLTYVGIGTENEETWMDVLRAVGSSISRTTAPKWYDIKMDIRHWAFLGGAIFIVVYGSRSIGSALIYALNPGLGLLVGLSAALQHIPACLESIAVMTLTGVMTAGVTGIIAREWCNTVIAAFCMYIAVNVAIRARDKFVNSWAATIAVLLLAAGYMHTMNGGSLSNLPIPTIKIQEKSTWVPYSLGNWFNTSDNGWGYAMLVVGRVSAMIGILVSLMVLVLGPERYQKIASQVVNANKKGATDKIEKHMKHETNFILGAIQTPLGVGLLIVYLIKMFLYTESFVNHVGFDAMALLLGYAVYKSTLEKTIDKQASIAANAGNFVITCQDKSLVSAVKDIENNTESTRKFLQVLLGAASQAAIITSWGAPSLGIVLAFIIAITLYLPGRHQRFAYSYPYVMYALSLIEWISPTLMGLAAIFIFAASNQTIMTWSKRGFMKFWEIVPDEGGKLIQAHS